jgi:all-trans-retinol 13,14-reductase
MGIKVCPILLSADYEHFREWTGQSWLRRADDYRAPKERIADGLLALVECDCPGFTKLVEHCEIATPLTYQHFTQLWMGAIFGLSLASERFRTDNDVWNNVRTLLPGLYQTGADQFLSGICGAMLAGILTVAVLPGGIGLAELITRCLRS